MLKNKGFTLIELVVVIVILGILAATALPKFINLSKDATIATLQGMQGAIRSGADMVYAKALVNDQITGSDNLVIGSITIELHSGYPIGNLARGFRYIVQLDQITYSGVTEICQVEWCGRGNQTATPAGTIASSGFLGKLYPKGYSWTDACGVYYINKEDGSKPEIGLETDDC